MEANHALTNSHSAPTNLQAATVAIRELSTDTQLKWIERIFSRLLAIYGDRFSQMWAHTDKDEMKRVWAEELGGFSSSDIAEGLRLCLDNKYPPNLPQFLEYCRLRPVKVARIEESTPVNPQKAKEMLAKAASILRGNA